MAEIVGNPSLLPTDVGLMMGGMAPRRVAVVVFPGIQSLDAIGPIEVFSTASREAGESLYVTEVVATEAGTVRTSSAVAIGVDHRLRDVRGPFDTVLVAGGDGTIGAMQDPALVDGVRRLAGRARRVASV